MKKLILPILGILLIAGVVYFLVMADRQTATNEDDQTDEQETPVQEIPQTEIVINDDNEEVVDETKTVIGESVENNDITAFHYGSGDTNVLFVGGIHGGYEWNTVLVAYELMDYLEANPESIPENVRVTVIPVLNPDGLNAVVGSTGRFTKAEVPTAEADTIPGRFNANDVDLNRNFDCDWQATGKWQDKEVSGGTEAFSEPESEAMRNYIAQNKPNAVITWYSAAGGVFASNCHSDILPETPSLTNVFAEASGYKAYEDFDFYSITGDMVNWLAKEKIPAISVLLTNHTDTEWSKNQKGVDAVLEYFAE